MIKILVSKLPKFLSKNLPLLYGMAGCFIIAGGWNYYHFSHKLVIPFLQNFVVLAIIINFGFFAGMWLLRRIIKKLNFHEFWFNDFYRYLYSLWLVLSLLFLTFFSKREWLSIVIAFAVISAFFKLLDYYFSQHTLTEQWRKINSAFFLVAIYVFGISGIFQLIARHYYIFDPSAQYYNVALFRTLAMTFVWLLLLAIAIMVGRGRRQQAVVMAIWAVLLGAWLIIWAINIGVLYFSGLYLNPTAVTHAEGAGAVIWNSLTFIIALLFAPISWLYYQITRRTFRLINLIPRNYSKFYSAIIAAAAVIVVIFVSSLHSTPEYIIVKSFYDHFIGKQTVVNINPLILEKLKKFGFNYNLNKFFVAQKPVAYQSRQTPLYTPTTTRPPNLIIFFLESFSTKLTSVYNSQTFPGLTPGLEMMATDKNTITFHNYYNGSTPTVTGLLSQLCSFLPPTGHGEIEIERRLQSHHLLCLPKILRRSGYNYSNYITAVAKDYAHKDTLLASMGVDEVFGTAELARYITDEPKAWGYSDHQMIPVLEQFMESKPQPFLMILSTVDTHPPFSNVKDVVNYQDGQTNVLNTFHTTDDAFRKFWENFKTSQFYDNTIVIAVADHAIFPAAYNQVPAYSARRDLSFYDENTFLMYLPGKTASSSVSIYSSGLDFAPTVLQTLGINSGNAFDGHSIFDDRGLYPNLLGMHELGLYINQVNNANKRQESFSIPATISCEKSLTISTSTPLTLCEYLEFYRWKRSLFETGRLWSDSF